MLLANATSAWKGTVVCGCSVLLGLPAEGGLYSALLGVIKMLVAMLVRLPGRCLQAEVCLQ